MVKTKIVMCSSGAKLHLGLNEVQAEFRRMKYRLTRLEPGRREKSFSLLEICSRTSLRRREFPLLNG